jgi:nucleoid-associated protein YgaU
VGLRGLVVWLAVGTLAWYWLIGWPPPALPKLPATLLGSATLELWLRSPLAADWTGFVAVIGLVGWLFWVWAWASVLLQAAVNIADAATQHAPWVTATRNVVRPLCVPFIRRIVDASLGGVLLARVALQPVAVEAAAPWGVEVATVAYSAAPSTSRSALDTQPPARIVGEVRASQDAGSDPGDQQLVHELLYHVQPGDSLWAIANRFYGDGEKESLLFDANVGRLQSDGRALTRHGVIYPTWILRVPDPSRGIDMDSGEWWYTVQPGDTLSGISAQLLGDAGRWSEVFQMNRGAQARDGHVLADPNIIWPGLRLFLPLDSKSIPPASSEPQAESTAAVRPAMAIEPDRQDRVPVHDEASPTTVPSPSPEASATSAPTPAPLGTTTPESAPPTVEAPATIQSSEQVKPVSAHPVPPAAAALGAAALAGGGLAFGRLVVRKRKHGRFPIGPESDIHIEDGFADVDPVEDLARRLARTSDPASAIASLLGQAYAAIFDEQLQPEQRSDVQGVTVAATRHGRSSTTLVLAAPLAARPHLVHTMRDAAERAFGSQVDVDGLVDQSGDVLVRVTWDPRRPISGDLLEKVGTTSARCAWPTPCLVPAQVLYDRQRLAINWHTLSHVLVACPTGQGAEIALTALVAALASVRAPEDLGLVVIAGPHTLPDEIGRLPHGLLDVIDSGVPEVVQRTLHSVTLEIDRRRQASRYVDTADIVVVLRELALLDPEAMATAATIVATGPQHGVRLLAATERTVSELLRICPFVDQLGTRLVLQTATEEDSVALLGMDGAEYLGAGGHALLRLEGRVPYRGWAHRVSADHLAQLVHLMGTRARIATPPPPDEPPTETVDASDELEEAESAEADDGGASPEADPSVFAATFAIPGRELPLLEKLRSAPIRVRCFGAREVWCGNRLLELGDAQLELLLLLAVQPVTGIQAELLIDALWAKLPANPPSALRVRRFDLRTELRQLVPELGSVDDPVPAKQFHTEKVTSLDPRLVASDVHEFTELLRVAPTLQGEDAIKAYEAALDLYRGDLLDSSSVPIYRWMYDVEPQVSLDLSSKCRLQHKEARLHLAELLAAGPEAGLARAEELYCGLCAEDLDNERLWISLFRVHERTGSTVGLEGAVRRYRNARIELGTTDITDIDKVPLPPNLERIVKDIRSRIAAGSAR